MLMYKLLFFLHKSNDDSLYHHFKDVTIKNLSRIKGKEIKIAKVEDNLLLDEKYSHFCEIDTPSRDEMDKLMNTKAGKELNKDLKNFHSDITIISINYGIDN
jgi:hypothetical protein